MQLNASGVRVPAAVFSALIGAGKGVKSEDGRQWDMEVQVRSRRHTPS